MAKSKNQQKKKHSYISVPSQIINSLSSSSLQSLLTSPREKSCSSNKPYSHQKSKLCFFSNPKLCFSTIIFLSFLGMSMTGFTQNHFLIPFSKYTRQNLKPRLSISSGYSDSELGLRPESGKGEILVRENDGFWKQNDGLGYKSCLGQSVEYRKESDVVVQERRKYLMVVVSGGLNQQRNQIVDAVVIARILGAALVLPVLQVNPIWADESEFSDIFEKEHFRRELANDVRIVSSLPSTHLMFRPVDERITSFHVSPRWIQQRYTSKLKRNGVLILRGMDSRLAKDLPSDLQKLRCKVAFHALRFAPPILELGNKLTERMRSKGQYLALHLRLEKDVWVRTGCLPGLSHDYDEVINNERKLRPELLTARSKMSYQERKLAGLCPLNAMEVTRLIKALGVPKDAKIYWAGGEPFGGKGALLPLIREFPNFYSKEDLALPNELELFRNKSSLMAAIDYIVSENSDVFMPSHGGNMGHAIQGNRAYGGHKKYITPNKRQMFRYFLNSSIPEEELNRKIKELHRDSLGQPMLRTRKFGRDVTKYPIPECMCKGDSMTKTDSFL